MRSWGYCGPDDITRERRVGAVGRETRAAPRGWSHRRRKVAAGHFVQRYYDPVVARLLSVDPVSTETKASSNFNRYNYAANSPYRFVAPDGRQVVVPIVRPAPVPVPAPVPDEPERTNAAENVTLAAVVVAIPKVQEHKTHVTYTLTKQGEFGTVTYFGRASGYGTPYQVMMLRYSRHGFRRLQGYGNPQLDRSGTGEFGRLAVRGREQQLIDGAGGVGSMGVGNGTRGVSTFNPLGRTYHEASNMKFGPHAAYTKWSLVG